LTHRPDLFGHLGIATELNAIYSLLAPEKIIFNGLDPIFSQIANTSLLEMLGSSTSS